MMYLSERTRASLGCWKFLVMSLDDQPGYLLQSLTTETGRGAHSARGGGAHHR
jgi:hypothetical protein